MSEITLQPNINTIELDNQVNSQFIKELEDKAFALLPHAYIYNDKREIIGVTFYDEETRPDWTYEEFSFELEVLCENENDKGIIHLGRELERIEKGVNLAVDISEFPEPDWIVEGFIVRNGLTLLYGNSGTGKTTLCLYLADAMSKGMDFFGLKCKPGKVLFVENDESPELLKSHRDKVGLPDRLLVANIEVSWNTSEGRFNKEFGDLLYYHFPDVVVIDAYTSLHIPDITRPDSALVLDELRRLAERYHCAMVIIHHVNKSNEQMGSSLHRAKMDSIVSLVQLPKDRIVLTQEKIRGSKFQPKVINFNPDTLEMRDASMTLKEQVLELQSLGLANKEIVDKFPKQHRGSVGRYLREKSSIPTIEESKARIDKGRS